MTPEATAQRQADIKARMTADMRRVIGDVDPWWTEGRITEVTERVVDEAMFYVEHLLAEAEGREEAERARD